MSATVVQLVEKDGMDKQKALEAALGQIERAFGKGSIMKLGQRESVVQTEAVPTGSLGLDIALGIGGLPRGRVVELLEDSFREGLSQGADIRFLPKPFSLEQLAGIVKEVIAV